MRSFLLALGAAFAALSGHSVQAATVLTWFPASDFNANTAVMDVTLGITGDVIDTFESTTLISGLTISLSGGVTSTTWSTLPALYSDPCSGLGIGAWDGTHAVTNTTTNQIDNCSTPSNIASTITFHYAPGTTQFGISLSNFQSTNPASPSFPITNHELFVNGLDLGTVESLAGSNWSPGIVRNAYLVVTATGGSSITSVGFENLSATDFLAFDHLAVATAPVTTPEPAPRFLLVTSAIILLVLHRRRAHGAW